MINVPGFPPGVKWLLIVNTVVFFLDSLIGIVPVRYFGLSANGVVHSLYLWTLVTYMFLHGGIGHILFNMLALWMFGADLERQWGTDRFLRFYFISGVGAGICVVVLNLLAPYPYGNVLVPTIGASGAIYGILLANAILFPRRIIYFMMMFPIEMRYFVLIMGLIAFLSSFQGGGGVSNYAHLGGLLFAYMYLKSPRGLLDPARIVGAYRDAQKDWKRRQARKKFEVYMRGSEPRGGRGPRVH